MHNPFIRQIAREGALIASFAVSVFVLSVALRYVTEPQWAAVRQKRTQLEHYRGYISSEDGYRKLQGELLIKNHQLQRRLDSLLESQGKSDDMSGLLELLITRASAADIRFVKMQPQNATPSGDHTIYPVILEMSTTYNALGRFISSLETLPHLVSVGRMGIEATADGKLKVHVLVNCHLYARERS